jgi:hypothetical protein
VRWRSISLFLLLTTCRVVSSQPAAPLRFTSPTAAITSPNGAFELRFNQIYTPFRGGAFIEPEVSATISATNHTKQWNAKFRIVAGDRHLLRGEHILLDDDGERFLVSRASRFKANVNSTTSTAPTSRFHFLKMLSSTAIPIPKPFTHFSIP